MKTHLSFVGVIMLFGSFNSVPASAEVVAPKASFYREFTTKVRKAANFKVPVPGSADFSFHYELEQGSPLLPTFADPLLSDLPSVPPEPQGYFRKFWDKVLLKDGSYVQLGDQKIPLTCIFISGQDNRFLGAPNPLFPEYLIKVYLVANDYTCTGPINPGWPATGSKKETWDTYIYYEVRDPTIMLPTEVKLRYRWAEYTGILVDNGGGAPL